MTIEETKKCPFCAEIIKKEAIKCRFCKKTLNNKEKKSTLNINIEVDEKIKSLFYHIVKRIFSEILDILFLLSPILVFGMFYFLGIFLNLYDLNTELPKLLILFFTGMFLKTFEVLMNSETSFGKTILNLEVIYHDSTLYKRETLPLERFLAKYILLPLIIEIIFGVFCFLLGIDFFNNQYAIIFMYLFANILSILINKDNLSIIDFVAKTEVINIKI